MKKTYFEIESKKPFSKSLIWKLNRDYYQQKGITAWSENLIPHHLTSNSMVGKTYAEFIFAILKDIAAKRKSNEVVYILELGAGHGRLAYHTLTHLQKMMDSSQMKLPSYCYVLSDIVEDNLTFFRNHPQFQAYIEEGVLDTCYFDAISSREIFLRHAKITIRENELDQPLLVIGNYFFDSLPTDLFFIRDHIISVCSAELHAKEDPKDMPIETLIGNIQFTYHKKRLKNDYYVNPIFNDMLAHYNQEISDTHLFFPENGLKCVERVNTFSKDGMILLTMDKGFHDLADLDNKKEPTIVRHGSMSIWVNYHAIGNYCTRLGGKALFPSFSNFHLEIGCLMFLPDGETYTETDAAYQRCVNDFGPDDYNTLKKMIYRNISHLNMMDLLAFIRLSAYDSTIFISLLPRIKQLIKTISKDERKRLAQSFHQIWNLYYHLDEAHDLGYELGGLFYDLGFHQEALDYFQHAVKLSGQKADNYYNRILCYYQLRKDALFIKTLAEAKAEFPNNVMLERLDDLDLNAA